MGPKIKIYRKISTIHSKKISALKDIPNVYCFLGKGKKLYFVI